MNLGVSTTMIQRGRSGVGQYVLALVRAWIESTEHLRLRLYVLEEDLPLFDFARPRAELATVPEAVRSPVRNILWHQFRLPRLGREQGLDVLHVPSYRRLVWSRSCPRVGTIHDLAPFHVEGKYDWKRMLYGRVVVKHLARRQDAIIAVSGQTARDLDRFFGLGPDRVSVIWNGIDHTRFLPGDAFQARPRVREQWRLEHPYFVYVSRLEHPAKNHVRLIEAFSRFKSDTGSDWLLVFGGGDWHGAETIRAAAAASPVSSAIRFLGFVPDGALPDLYRGAGALVYPSLFEGFGLPPVEAMACGCPVISSTRGALAEVVAGAARTVNPENTSDLVAALTEMARAPERRDHWRQAGLANARRFDWQRCAAETLAVLRRAAAT